MAFRKRNVGVIAGANPGGSSRDSKSSDPASPGFRPSPLDGRATTSTGTPTLDGLLAGHSGLPMGTSLLIEESGTTDYAGALLRVFAAQGLIQRHRVHVVGLGDNWARELPGLVESTEKASKESRSIDKSEDRMKIAWRYERLGQFEAAHASTTSRGGISPCWSIECYVDINQRFLLLTL
jgi:elongator complex protein 4